MDGTAQPPVWGMRRNNRCSHRHNHRPEVRVDVNSRTEVLECELGVSRKLRLGELRRGSVLVYEEGGSRWVLVLWRDRWWDAGRRVAGWESRSGRVFMVSCGRLRSFLLTHFKFLGSCASGRSYGRAQYTEHFTSVSNLSRLRSAGHGQASWGRWF